MMTQIESLNSTIEEFKEVMGERYITVGDIIIWLEKYIRTTFSVDKKEKKGDDLMVPFDAAINISIALFNMIDRGNTGIDDQLVEELKKIKTKYLGMQ